MRALLSMVEDLRRRRESLAVAFKPPTAVLNLADGLKKLGPMGLHPVTSFEIHRDDLPDQPAHFGMGLRQALLILKAEPIPVVWGKRGKRVQVVEKGLALVEEHLERLVVRGLQ